MKTNQKGFSAIEGILVLVIVGLIGFVGWYVWQSNKTMSDVTSDVTGKASSQSTAEPDEQKYVGKRYTSSMGAFSMELLNGWTVEEDTTYDYFFQYDVSKLKYDKAITPVVSKTDASGVGGYVPGIKVSVNEYNEEVNNDEKFILNDGTVGYCSKTVDESNEDMEDGLGSFISKECFFKKGSQKLSASYSYYEKQPLNVDAIEYSFKTIQILK